LPLCKICNTSDNLCNSHIIPRGFYRNLQDRTNVRAYGPGTFAQGRRLPDALYDNSSICQDCESSIFSPLDDYAIQILRDKRDAIQLDTSAIVPHNFYIFQNVDKLMILLIMETLLILIVE